MATKKVYKLSVIFTSYNRGLIALAKSLLDDCKIKYFIKNETLDTMFGSGVIFKGIDPIIPPVEIFVEEKHKDKAKLLLKELYD